jgi:hypothetical protein
MEINRPDLDPVVVKATWRISERYWTPLEHSTIKAAARQCVRYEAWRLTPKAERRGSSFPELTGEKVIARLVEKCDRRWGKMASAALILTRLVDFRAGCGRPLTVSELAAQEQGEKGDFPPPQTPSDPAGVP